MEFYPITVIIPHKDRHNNLDKCLSALEAQTLTPARVVVSDWSHNKVWTRAMLMKRPEGKLGSLGLIMAGEPEHYQLTHARNAGRKQVKTPLMAVLDADCILPPDMLKWVSNMIGPFPGGTFRKAVLGAVVHHRDAAGVLGRVAWSGTIISGGWQVFRTEDFDKVGGYNPFITGWGFEDQDFVKRMVGIGCEPILLGPEHGYEHLYHEPEQTAEERATQEARNIAISERSIFDGKGWILKRNNG